MSRLALGEELAELQVALAIDIDQEQYRFAFADRVLVSRMIAPDGQALRAMAIRAVALVRGAPMPRVWTL